MNDIDITKNISIEDFKNKITSDGTYQNIKSILTIGNNIITVGAKIQKVIFKNITIKCSNQNGLITAPTDEYYENSLVTFDNIIFNGTSMATLEYNEFKILDSIITTKNTDNAIPS